MHIIKTFRIPTILIALCMIFDLIYYGMKIHFEVTEHTNQLQPMVAGVKDENGNNDNNGRGYNNERYNQELTSKSTFTLMYILGVLIISPYLYILTFHNESVSEFPWWSEFKLYFCDLLQHVVFSLVAPSIHVARNSQMRRFLYQRVRNFYSKIL